MKREKNSSKHASGGRVSILKAEVGKAMDQRLLNLSHYSATQGPLVASDLGFLYHK